MQISLQETCKLLQDNDNIVILAHQKPDGDTLGASFALLYALEQLGKTARVECADDIPGRYRFICGDYTPTSFEPAFVVTADVAGLQLLGKLAETYGNRVDLCIDHHVSNDMPAAHTLLDAKAPAASQIMLEVIRGLGVTVDKRVANAIFTGLSTDTGCFKYDNVTPATHRAAAEMIEAGADHGTINKLMFDTKSKGRLAIESDLLNTLEYYFDDQCAVITVAYGLPEQYGVDEDDLDGLSALPRRIEGVKAGVTIREREKGLQRVSLRTGDGLDASKICNRMGGGGHTAAAGCTISGTSAQAKQRVLDEIKKELEQLPQ